MAAVLGLPVSLLQIEMAAAVAWLLVVSVWLEILHRRERRWIEEYRSRLKSRLDRRDADKAYANELAVRPLSNLPVDEGVSRIGRVEFQPTVHGMRATLAALDERKVSA